MYDCFDVVVVDVEEVMSFDNFEVFVDECGGICCDDEFYVLGGVGECLFG